MKAFWRGLAILLVGGVLGTGFGVAVGFFVYPFVFPPPDAAEVLTAEEGRRRCGGDRHLYPCQSPVIPSTGAKGGSAFIPRRCSLRPISRSGPGPAFKVYLVPKQMIRRSGDVVGTMYVDLGKLRAFKGSQGYAIPDGVDLADFPSVVIWCEAFSVLISPADLTF